MPILANVIQDAFSPLISVFEAIMVFIHAHLVGGSWGLAIVGLTVLIRAVLVPLTYRQLKGMQEMQRLSPQIAALKEKYKDDKQRQQQEIMAFYRENKINPLASCLPLLLQLPVFISLFYMLRTDLKKHICGTQLVTHYNTLSAHAKAGFGGSAQMIANVSHLPAKFIEKTNCQSVDPHSAKFLFLPDITEKATGVALIVLILLYVGSQIASTLVATATADPNQRRLMLLLPLVFVVILYRYPAGLLVYWITTNVWTIGQQYLIKRHMGPPPAKEEATGASNGKATRALKPALAGAGAGASASGGSGSGGGLFGRRSGQTAPAEQPERKAAPPPRSPRKKKKRSGRRR
ncbi:MAG TPA: YidC/Oxa1 family membrane protein insertase [Solirubrobacteraceae bacterium]|jgi:YidC/Oxa1 family membrane protein insertase|nr:YidC/Oxa1 family membrane protein insertase [Solirubrobacteraceae bacterium]